MSDLISRQAAIDALRRAEALTNAFGYHNVIETIRELPSAQQWTPCAERLPEERTDVLIIFPRNGTMAVGYYERFNKDVAVGYYEQFSSDGITWYVNTGDGWYTTIDDVSDDGIPVAWTPLPEPYKEISDG